MKVSIAPASNITPSSPGANATSKFCKILLMEQRSDMSASALPGHWYGPMCSYQKTSPTRPILSPLRPAGP